MMSRARAKKKGVKTWLLAESFGDFLAQATCLAHEESSPMGAATDAVTNCSVSCESNLYFETMVRDVLAQTLGFCCRILK